MSISLPQEENGFSRTQDRGLIPQPREILYRQGELEWTPQSRIFVNREVKKLCGDALRYFTDKMAASTLHAPVRTRQASSAALVFASLGETDLPAEAYCLSVGPKRITIKAKDRAGFFYGVQTLLQLFDPEIYNPRSAEQRHASVRKLPCVEITDYPRFAYRGMMLDVSRQFFDVAFVKQYIDRMSMHKLNVFHWHLSDDNGWRIEIKKYPLLTQKGAWRGPDEALPAIYGSGRKRYGGYYTQKEIKEIVAYAAARQITVIPEIDLPGHSRAAAVSYPAISCLNLGNLQSVQGETNNVWCLSREENYRMLEGIVKELCRLFPGPYIHIGGDEVNVQQWKTCSRCRAFMEEKGMHDVSALRAYFVERMENMAEKYGKTVIGWDDIVKDGSLHDSTVVMVWHGIKPAREAVQKGYRVIMQPAEYCYFDMKYTGQERGMKWAGIIPLEKVYSFDPVQTAGLTEREAPLIMGVQGALWSELLDRPARFAESQTYPRLCALAEIGWSAPEDRQWKSFFRRLNDFHYERLYNMDIAFRVPVPEMDYAGGFLSAKTESPRWQIRYTDDESEPSYRSALYTRPLATGCRKTAEKYRFSCFYKADLHSAAVSLQPSTSTYQKPETRVEVSFAENPQTSLDVLCDYDFGTSYRMHVQPAENDYVLYTFEQAVKADRITLKTGIPGLDIYTAELAHVEYSCDGKNFLNAGNLENGSKSIRPMQAVKAVKLCFDKGNTISNIYLRDLFIE